MDAQYKADRAIIARTIIVGFLVNVLLAIGKLCAGVWGHSQALIADGFHSLSDIITDVLVYVSAQYSRRSADQEHPYGHGRFETLAITVLALLLFLVALGIVYDALVALWEPMSLRPSGMVLWVAIGSIVLKEGLYWFTKIMAKRIDSNLLLANAWHHRSDAASSIVVLVAVVGTMNGLPFLDAIAAIIVGIFIVSIAIKLMRSSVRELVDAGVDDQVLQEIKNVLLATEGIVAMHRLRTRLLGGKIFVDVHVLVSPKITVSEGHYIADQAHQRLNDQIANIVDVTIHVDPEDDEIHNSDIQLLQRTSLEQQLYQACATLAGINIIEDIKIHYLSGQLQVELYVPISVLDQQMSADVLQKQYEDACKHIKHLHSVQLVFIVPH